MRNLVRLVPRGMRSPSNRWLRGQLEAELLARGFGFRVGVNRLRLATEFFLLRGRARVMRDAGALMFLDAFDEHPEPRRIFANVDTHAYAFLADGGVTARAGWRSRSCVSGAAGRHAIQSQRSRYGVQKRSRWQRCQRRRSQGQAGCLYGIALVCAFCNR